MALTAVVVAGGSLSAARTAASGANFTASAKNAGSTFTAAQLSAPTALAGSVSGTNVALTWTKGDSIATGYDVRGATLTGSACGTFAQIGTSASTSYTDAGRANGTTTGYCYEVVGTIGGWTSPVSSVLQLTLPTTPKTFQVSSVVIANGPKNASGCSGNSGQSGQIDCGDTITVTFNQAVKISTGPQSGDSVCVDGPDGSIDVSTTGSNGTCSGDTVHLGTLTIPTSGFCFIGLCTDTERFAASYTWSAGNTVVTIVVGTEEANAIFGGTPTVSPVSAFAPVAALTSQTGTAICTTSACEPAPTTGF